MKIAFALEIQPRQNLHLFKTFYCLKKNVFEVDVTEVVGADGVASTLKMKQLKGVSLHKLAQKRWQKCEREYFT
jgi:hypothetical protein